MNYTPKTLKELPIPIRNLALIRRDGYNKSRYIAPIGAFDIMENYNDYYVNNLFAFRNTPEGTEFWLDISRGKYNKYYRMYET